MCYKEGVSTSSYFFILKTYIMTRKEERITIYIIYIVAILLIGSIIYTAITNGTKDTSELKLPYLDLPKEISQSTTQNTIIILSNTPDTIKFGFKH